MLNQQKQRNDKINNKMTVRFWAVSQNESLARLCISAFASQCNPTLNQLADIKTAVSEAVTNAIIHAYTSKGTMGEVQINATLSDETLSIEVTDFGKGIEDISQALTPFYTTGDSDERSGMGFTVMETFMDSLEVVSNVNQGTTVRMTKRLSHE